MDEAVVNDEVDIDSEVDILAEGRSKRLSGKKIILYFALPVLLILGAVVGLILGGIFSSSDEQSSKGQNAPSVRAVFFDLPEILVNLNTAGRKPTFLKMQVSLEITRESDVARLRILSPRIMDNFQVYLRELRIEDLRGSAGIYRLREELLARVSASVHPIKVNDILFKEMLIQ